jgi:hypothetical protein
MSPLKAGTEFDHPRRSRSQKLGAILWPSFFAAGVATMVCSAIFDPVELIALVAPGHDISRETGYALGFFLFWAATCASSMFTWILLRPASRFNRPLR